MAASNKFPQQICASNDQYFQPLVASYSRPNAFYQLTIPYPDAPKEEWICTCYDWQHRSHIKGYCKHIADYRPCYWPRYSVRSEPEQQSVWQERAHICPRCGSSTIDVGEK